MTDYTIYGEHDDRVQYCPIHGDELNDEDDGTVSCPSCESRVNIDVWRSDE